MKAACPDHHAMPGRRFLETARGTLVALMLLIALPASAHEYLTFDALMEAFNTDFDRTEVRTETLAPGLYALFGAGGNVIVSIGDQGVLMVDSQYEQMMPKLKDEIARLGGDSVDFTINTHWHFDHSGGNPAFGREGSWFVAHRNSRRMMMNERAINLVSLQYLQPKSPPEALPIITFDESMQFHFNGHAIDLLHFGPAHTTGDTAVYFRDANVVHMGDVFNNGFPFIDADNGGDIDGVIRFCRKLRSVLDEDSVVLPGHGPILGYADLDAYIDMLETSRDRIVAMLDAGMSLAEVIAADPTAEFNERYGNPARFIDRAYHSLAN